MERSSEQCGSSLDSWNGGRTSCHTPEAVSRTPPALSASELMAGRVRQPEEGDLNVFLRRSSLAYACQSIAYLDSVLVLVDDRRNDETEKEVASYDESRLHPPLSPQNKGTDFQAVVQALVAVSPVPPPVMTAHYHVFLPPLCLAPLPIPPPTTDYSPLHFCDLPAPPRHPIFSQSSLSLHQANITTQLLESEIELPRVVLEENGSLDASARKQDGDEKGSRSSVAMRLEQRRDEVFHERELEDLIVVKRSRRGRQASPDQSRRRSSRIARTSRTYASPPLGIMSS